MNNKVSKIKLTDIRDFARSIIEDSNDLKQNKTNYLEIVGDQIRNRIDKSS